MRREDDDWEDDRDRPRRSRRPRSHGRWHLSRTDRKLIAILAGFLVPIALLVFAITAYSRMTNPTFAKFDRNEFQSLVIGKTQDEILRNVGRPDRTKTVLWGEFWEYDRKTIDPISGKQDRLAEVYFVGGKVLSVDFR